jgi:hypothetical protein
LSLKNSVRAWLPVQIFQPDATADDWRFILVTLKNHRRAPGAGIFRGKHERSGQIISAAAQKNVSVFLPRRLLHALQRGEWFR